MKPDAAKGFLGTYQKALQRLDGVADGAEQAASSPRTPERLVASIWYGQKLDIDNLRTADGRKLRILSPGRWNSGPGPDFLDAQIRVGRGKVQKGDVEIHAFASDWERHRHSENPAYSAVCLHACMWNDLRRPHEDLPLLEMFGFLLEPAHLQAVAADSAPPASAPPPGRCNSLLSGQRIEHALQFIAAAGDARIQAKSERMASIARAFGNDQTLFKGLMEAAGYSANKRQLSRLADVLHLERIRDAVSSQPLADRQSAILALMYGCCGFFENDPSSPLPDSLARLRRLWEELRAGAGDGRPFVVIRGIGLARVRPANNPFRRLAAVSHLLGPISGLKLFDYFAAALGNVRRTQGAKAAGRRLRSLLTGLSDPYWDFHLSAKARPLNRRMKLIGDGLASVMVVNILVPLLLAHARKTQNMQMEVFLHELLKGFGGQGHNSITRFVCSRLFGQNQSRPRYATNARLHQGLIQIYYDFCHSLRVQCPECDLYDFLLEEESRSPGRRRELTRE